MPFVAVYRWIAPALHFRGGLQAPRNVRAEFGTLTAGAYPCTVRWNPPPSWGNDSEGTGTREYSLGYRQIRNPDGTPHTGSHANWFNTATVPTDLDHVLPNLPEDSVWQFRIRSINKLNQRSEYAQIDIHASKQNGFIILEHKYLLLEGKRLRIATGNP